MDRPVPQDADELRAFVDREARSRVPTQGFLIDWGHPAITAVADITARRERDGLAVPAWHSPSPSITWVGEVDNVAPDLSQYTVINDTRNRWLARIAAVWVVLLLVAYGFQFTPAHQFPVTVAPILVGVGFLLAVGGITALLDQIPIWRADSPRINRSELKRLTRAAAARHYPPATYFDSALIPIRDAGAGPELGLDLIATETMHAITSSAAWSSPFLDNHRILLDPATQLHEIRTHAHRITALRRRMQPEPSGDSAEANRAREIRRDEFAILDRIYESLLGRVTELVRYRDEVLELSDRVEAIARIEQSVTMSTELEELYGQMVSDDLAAERTRELTDTVRSLREQLSPLLDRAQSTLVKLTAGSDTVAPESDAGQR